MGLICIEKVEGSCEYQNHIHIMKNIKRMFDYILDNNMKINIDDDRFMIERCGKHYGDYLQWEKIKVQSQEYRI